MFSDTHFHFKMMVTERGIDGVEVLSKMADRDCFLGLDIGTKPEDLLDRQAFLDKTIDQIADGQISDRVRDFIYFSAGIWPEVEYIHNREESVNQLIAQIQRAAAEPDRDTLHRKIIAIGECGLDHHWNPSGADGRSEEDFDSKTYQGERELFEMQLELAKKLCLPVIVHSRDAFTDTLECIQNIGYDNGIIHCFSYGLDEAKAFLERGWFISFGGGVTYTKRSHIEQMRELLRYVPSDRILIETDAPYLSPVPLRGCPNTPLNIEHTYKYVADMRDVSVEELSKTVDENIDRLFLLR